MAAGDRVALEEVTEAAFNGVLRALEARKFDITKLPWPIIVGIIAVPELGGQFELRQGAKSGGRSG
jgi:hypothetical protein